MPRSMRSDDQQRRTSLVVPILLITLGALFLFRNWRPGFDPVHFLRMNWQMAVALVLILVGLGKIWDSSRSRGSIAPGGTGPGATGSGATGQGSTGVALGSTIGVVAAVVALVVLLGHFQKSRHRYSGGE